MAARAGLRRLARLGGARHSKQAMRRASGAHASPRFRPAYGRVSAGVYPLRMLSSSLASGSGPAVDVRSPGCTRHIHTPARVAAESSAADEAAAAALRRNQLDAWYDRHDRYPHWPTTMTLGEFQEAFGGLEAGARDPEVVEVVAGRVAAKRQGSKSTAFLDIQSGGTHLQVLAIRGRYTGGPGCSRGDSDGGNDGAYPPAQEFADITALVRRGDIIGVRGFPGKSKTGELSIIPTEVALLAPCLPNLPAAREGVTDRETRYRNKPLDLLANPHAREVLFARSRVVSAVRRYLEDRGFLEVETPLLHTSAGGALARPFVTRSWAWGVDLSLRIAPELFLKRLVVGGIDRVFEIGKVFRNEGVTPRHNPEFTTCEFYQAYATLDDLMAATEGMMEALVTAAIGSPTLTYRPADAPESDPVDINFAGPYRRLWIIPALEEALGRTLPDPNDPESAPEFAAIADSIGALEGLPKPHTTPRLLDRLVGEILEPQCVQPTFLCGHPIAMSPLAKRSPDDPRTTARFELFVAGTEVVNAYSELNDPVEQRRRFAAQATSGEAGDDEAHVVDEDYCGALEYGLPPTGGWGMGIDRVITLLTGSAHIREVLSFPIMKPQLQGGSQPSDDGVAS